MNKSYRVPIRVRLTRPAVLAALRLSFRILGRVKVRGKENIPLGKPYVLAMNHISIFDPPLIASFWPEYLEIIAAAEIFDKPGQGQILKLYGAIPIQRGGYNRTLMMMLVSMIKGGYPLLISPEGERSHVTAMQRALPGVAYIIEKTGVPVVPAGLVGTTDDFWQRGKRGQKPLVEIRIGKPFHPPQIIEKGAARREARQRNADLIMRRLAGLLPEEYWGYYADSVIFPSQTSE
ncbi:MAG: lysophospholipid acyltransferase family protein [Anaerolineae bacterium]|nr:lysophospholipid acyltransferase family protein [Anaerolineae bacterium]MDK1080626.1 lysophospholipid acyltransferase family protein [Anaerolineae bacterium]MDK1117580.1 lysophospholipid acyltransferase family protein [Anaerolineae bacterium]